MKSDFSEIMHQFSLLEFVSNSLYFMNKEHGANEFNTIISMLVTMMMLLLIMMVMMMLMALMMTITMMIMMMTMMVLSVNAKTICRYAK